MNRFIFALLPVLICVGCGKEKPAPVVTVQVPTTGPITLEVWKAIQEEEKFSSDVLSRLRSSDPSLKSNKAWEKFRKEVVDSEFKRFRSR